MRQANDLLEYRDIIVKGFEDGTFPSKHLKKSDDAAYICAKRCKYWGN